MCSPSSAVLVQMGPSRMWLWSIYLPMAVTDHWKFMDLQFKKYLFW